MENITPKFTAQIDLLCVLASAVATMRVLQKKAAKSHLSPDYQAAGKAEKAVDAILAQIAELNPPDANCDLFGAI
jgi:hypothetical protein